MSKVFLCHSSVDKVFARKLASDLNAQNLSVWIDEKEILVGDPIRQKIEEGLNESDYLAIVLSPDSVASAWVQKELDAKLIEEIESKRVVVLPLYFRPCEMPSFLVGKHYADFRQDYDAGLKELLARFRQGNREDEVKSKVIQRLAGLDPSKIDPHALLQLTIHARQFEATEDLAAAHAASHPNCPHVALARGIMVTIKHDIEGTPKSWSDAISFAFEFIKKNPHPNNYNNLDALIKKCPRQRECAQYAMRIARDCIEAVKSGERAWAPHLAGRFIIAVETLPLEAEEKIEVCKATAELIELLPADNLSASLSPLLHVGTHFAEKSLVPSERDEILHRLVNAAEPKIRTSSEYSDAFLHLAWARAKLGDAERAKELLGKYRLTVPAQTYAKQTEKHPPLRDIAAAIA